MGTGAERQSHRYTGEPLSRGNKERASKYTLLVYAGTSLRRLSFLKYAVDLPTIQVPGGDESEARQDSMVIMKGKLAYGRGQLEILTANGELKAGTKPVLVAADTVSIPLLETREGIILPQTQGKPDHPDQTRQLFGKMRRTTVGGRPATYIVDSSSGLLNGGERPNSQRMISVVELDSELVKHWSTPRGFEDYEALFDEFHRTPLYVNGGEHRPVGVRDASGGFSLPAFMMGGAVKSIDHIPPVDKRFRNALANAHYTAFVGIHPGVLRGIQPDIRQRVANWQWGQEVTDYTMKAMAA